MAKRNLATLVVAAALAMSASEVRAQQIPIAVDGCAELARVIYAEVSAAALYGPGKSGPWIIDSGQGDIFMCTHTAKTVSRAFTAAMMSAGIEVYWGHESGVRDDYCLSGFLSRCYPNRGTRFFVVHNVNTALVQKSWAVVSQSVMRAMHNPFSSDEVRFRDNDLKLRIGLSLRSIAAVDRHGRYDR
jgi:hypothetical protein